MQKSEKIKSQLVNRFKASKVRSIDGVIRFNVPSLSDNDLTFLVAISMVDAVDVSIKRSGTGLAVIVKL